MEMLNNSFSHLPTKNNHFPHETVSQQTFAAAMISARSVFIVQKIFFFFSFHMIT